MSKVKSKSFIISTLITLVFLFGIANLDVIINFFSQDDKDTVAVIDESDQLFAPFKETVESTNPDIELVKVEDDLDTVLTDVENETYEALIVLSINNEQMPEGTYYANRISDFGMHWEMEQHLQQLKIAMATNLAGIDQAIIEQIYEPISFQTVALDEDAKTGEEMSQTRGIVYIMLFVLYMANRIIDTMRMPNDNAISHTGIFNIPTRKNMTIGVKNGIYEDTVIKVVSGTDNPNMAMKNAMIIKKIIGIITC